MGDNSAENKLTIATRQICHDHYSIVDTNLATCAIILWARWYDIVSTCIYMHHGNKAIYLSNQQVTTLSGLLQ